MTSQMKHCGCGEKLVSEVERVTGQCWVCHRLRSAVEREASRAKDEWRAAF